MNTFQSNRPVLTLGQFLKVQGLIGSGGEAKFFLTEHNVTINGVRRTERGAKLVDGDTVKVDGTAWTIRA
jgi:ribosome-associated protein YbcJ (S4-like RNA binding protein)